MAGRTFAIGDIHGELDHLRTLLGRMPTLTPDDTVVFLGDYIDRGPASEEVIRVVRRLHQDCGAKVVCLRGDPEDAWLRVVDQGLPELVFPPQNGCLPRCCSDKELRSATGPTVIAADTGCGSGVLGFAFFAAVSAKCRTRHARSRGRGACERGGDEALRGRKTVLRPIQRPTLPCVKREPGTPRAGSSARWRCRP